YQSLVSDVLSTKLNRITIETMSEGKVSRKGFDLEADDFFWKKNAAVPFPQVAEGRPLYLILFIIIDIDAELSQYKQDAARLTRQTGVSSVEDVGNLYCSAY